MLGIGIDSGGSRTNYAVMRAGDEDALTKSETGASISTARSQDTIGHVGEWIVDMVDLQADDEICVWIGAAGFSASTSRTIQERLAPSMRRLAHSMEEQGRHCEVYIANDAVAMLKAPPLLGAGVVAVVGTGSVVIGTHPRYEAGVVKRGGYEWLASDEGAGVWMTIQAIRLILKDIETRGPREYHSPLLDRLADHLGISDSELSDIPNSYAALAKADLVARRMAESRADHKRFLARFVYPHIFDLASLEPGRPHDPIASEVLSQSVEQIVADIRIVSDILSAHTADEPNLREKVPLIMGGNIAANPIYDQRLRAMISTTCRSVASVGAIGDASGTIARLALHYLESDSRTQRQIVRSLDPLHPVLRLL